LNLQTSLIHWGVPIFVIFLAACSQKPVDPVEIDPSDMCSYCKMAISEKRYAAEFIDKQGEAHKFDDLGCMKQFLQTKKLGQDGPKYFFAIDYESKQWLPAQLASFVRSNQFKTPMSGGIVAIREKIRAAQLAQDTQGTVITFAELFGNK
jgi:copper chaperone NosL